MVMIWDMDGKPSEWSKPSFWSMGLMDAADWKAEWIGFDKEVGEPYDPSLPYYVADEYLKGENKLYLPPPPYLRKEFTLSGKVVKSCCICISAGYL